MNKKVPANINIICRLVSAWWIRILNTYLHASRPVMITFVILFVINHGAVAGIVEAPLSQQEIKVVWAADHGNGEQIFFSSYANNGWSDPVQLSNEEKMTFQPAVSTGRNGKIWVVWSNQGTEGSFLQFSVGSSSQWSVPQQINTGMTTNTAAAILVGNDNYPVIAWTGIDNLYPDIFWSRWNGKGWDTPRKVHVDNEVPDLQPALYLDSIGKIVLSWQTFRQGKYVEVVKMLQDGQWQQIPQQSGNVSTERKKVPPVPEFIEDIRKASFFIRNSDGAHSILPARR